MKTATTAAAAAALALCAGAAATPFQNATDMKTRMEAAVTATALELSSMYYDTVSSGESYGSCPHTMMCDAENAAWGSATMVGQYLNPATSSCVSADLDKSGDQIAAITGRVAANRAACAAEPWDPEGGWDKADWLDHTGCTSPSDLGECTVASEDYYGVTLPDGSTMEPTGQLGAEICATNQLLPDVQQNAADMPEAGWHFLGTQGTGLYRSWPTPYQCRTENQCSGCSDPRYRGWYASTASGPKEVVIVMDVSGSMGVDDRMGDAKTGAKWVVNTLTDIDYVAFVRFSTGAAAWKEELVQATAENRRLLKEHIDTLSPDGGTEMAAGMSVAFDVLDRSGSKTGCTGSRSILFLSDGENEKSAGSPKKVALARNAENPDNPARVFTYAFGNGDISMNLLRQTACKNNGVFYVVKGNDVKTVMASYFTILAAGLAPSATDTPVTYTRWVDDYEDGQGRGPMTAACAPSWNYDSNPPTLFAISCLGVYLPVAEGLEGWDEVFAEMQSERRTCPEPYLSPEQLDGLRASSPSAQTCVNGAARAAGWAAVAMAAVAAVLA